jgi:hypothetical protein
MTDKTPEQVVDEALKRARTNRPKQPDPPPKNSGLSDDEKIEEGLIRARQKLSGRDKLIDNLAKKDDPIDYALERKVVARELGVPTTAVDDAVALRREDRVAEPLYGYWIVDPWSEPVEASSLLQDIIDRFRRHVVISDDGVLAASLWLMMSWVHDAIATHSPILNINSAEPESGKSTLMGLMSFLMPKCIASVEVSEAAIYRSIKRWRPSFCFDEFDNVLVSDDKAALRSVINSGHARNQGVLRCTGDDKIPELFDTFAPKAIGMIDRKLPPATLSRCIFIDLQRKKDDEPTEKFKHQDDNELSDLRRRLRRWAMDYEDILRTANPSMPDELRNRRADNWHLQLAIADLTGEDWGRKARAAAIRIEIGSDSGTPSAKALAAIRTVFASVDGDVISSEELITKITEDPSSDWQEWRSGKPITQTQLARLLKRYRIAPEQVRIDGRQVRGYVRGRFIEAWERYL